QQEMYLIFDLAVPRPIRISRDLCPIDDMVVGHEWEAIKNGGGMMASEFGEQNSGHALAATDFGVKWVREIAEQSLSQTEIALIGFWKIGKEISDHLEKQSSAVRHHATALAEK